MADLVWMEELAQNESPRRRPEDMGRVSAGRSVGSLFGSTILRDATITPC